MEKVVIVRDSQEHKHLVERLQQEFDETHEEPPIQGKERGVPLTEEQQRAHKAHNDWRLNRNKHVSRKLNERYIVVNSKEYGPILNSSH
jgi:hypothetical protein